MVPKPGDIKYSSAFLDYGDRTPDWNYAQKGLLKSIIYPTGGIQSFEYEANTIFNNAASDCTVPSETINLDVSGVSYLKHTNIYSTKPFTSTCAQQVSISLSCLLPSGSSAYPPGEYSVFASLVDGNSNSPNTPVYLYDAVNGSAVSVGLGEDKNFAVNLQPGYYKLIIYVLGNGRGRAAFSFTNSYPFTGNKETAGVRVKRILSYDKAGDHNEIKHYYYNELASDRSTGIMFSEHPFYQMQYKTYTNLSSVTWGAYAVRNYTSFSSSNYYGLSNLTGNHIYYSTVYESNGDNYENGGTQHDFQIANDSYPVYFKGFRIAGCL
jgi:hypothetical protein